jgi:uncharacterized protein (TIGR03435 family)
LIERFKLKVHHELREMPIYEMSIVKDAPALKPHNGDAVLQAMDNPGTGETPARDKDGYPLPGPGAWGMLMSANNVGLYRFNGLDVSMVEFAWGLSNQLGRTVVDATGLKGKYDFVLSWSVDMTPPSMPPAPGDASATTSPPPPPAPVGRDVMEAIQRQLGLKLELKKGPVDMLVVDHFEKVPTAN